MDSFGRCGHTATQVGMRTKGNSFKEQVATAGLRKFCLAFDTNPMAGYISERWVVARATKSSSCFDFNFVAMGVAASRIYYFRCDRSNDACSFVLRACRPS